MEAKAILFHSNEKARCEQFLKSGQLIISSNDKDDIWLGKGMYFWDNRGNVDWWNHKQKSRNPGNEFSIIAVNAMVTNTLDLTDSMVCKKINAIWEGLCAETGRSPDCPLGIRLNCLFSLPDFNEQYDCTKVLGKYKNAKTTGLFTFNYLSGKSEPFLSARCIYSIRKAECILEKELVEDEGGVLFDKSRKP